MLAGSHERTCAAVLDNARDISARPNSSTNPNSSTYPIMALKKGGICRYLQTGVSYTMQTGSGVQSPKVRPLDGLSIYSR
jgi:hypothetical protein